MNARFPLDPFPVGWYCVGFSHEVRARASQGTWCGRLLELGRVDGRPLARPLDGGPEVPLIEQQGVVLGWFDHDGGPPRWELPVPDPTGWTSYRGHTFPRFRSHPQETSENSVDVAHLTVVHGYENVETVEEAVTDGPVLEATYAFTRQPLPVGFATTPIRSQFTVWVYGLGYSYVENHVEAWGLRTRQLVLCTPIDGEFVELRIAGATTVDMALPSPLRMVARRFVRHALMRAYVQDVSADLAIWEHKVYQHPPRMVPGDGPINRYRRWCRQFYREHAAA